MATLGLFDPEVRQEALFDATVIEAGRFDPELVDAAAGGGTQTAQATPSITLSLAPNASATRGATAAPSITLSLAPNASATLGATATPSITLSLAPVARVIALATATPSITLSLGPVALKIAVATATPSITLSLAPNASATLGATATPSITLSLAPVGLKVTFATATPSITLSLSPVGVRNQPATATPSITLSLAPTAAVTLQTAQATPSITLALLASATALGQATPSITLSLAPVALKVALATATPSITLTLAPSGVWVARAQATPSVLLTLAPAAVRVQPATATPSITLSLAAETPAPVVNVIEAHTVPPPPTLISITDSFDRADDALSLGTPDTGQVWSALAGVWGISGNGAVLVSGAGHRLAILESELSDATIQVTLSPTDAGQSSLVGLAVRVQDASNYLVFYIRPDQALCRIGQVVAGGLSTLDTGSFPGPATSVLRVECSGTTIRGYADGVLACQATGVTNFRTATRHGLYAFLPEVTTWNDFSVVGETLPAPTIRLILQPTAQAIGMATTYTTLNTANEQGLREVAISHRGSP